MELLTRPLFKVGAVVVTPLTLVAVVAVWYFLLRKR